MAEHSSSDSVVERPMRIGILGSGDVGQALARGLARHGHHGITFTELQDLVAVPLVDGTATTQA